MKGYTREGWVEGSSERRGALTWLVVLFSFICTASELEMTPRGTARPGLLLPTPLHYV